MAIYFFPLDYQLDGAPDPVRIVADQRDVAAWEAEPFGGPVTGNTDDQPITFWRYLAWRAYRRGGEVQMTWDRWQKECVWADVRPDPPADAEDPGRPGQSDTP